MPGDSPSPKRSRDRPKRDQGLQGTDFLDSLTISLTSYFHKFQTLYNACNKVLGYYRAVARHVRLPPVRWWLPLIPLVLVTLMACYLYDLYFLPFTLSRRPPLWSPWVVDSTTLFHTTNDMKDFSTYQAFDIRVPLDPRVKSADVLMFPSFDGEEVHGSGTVDFQILDESGKLRCSKLNFLYVPYKPKRISLRFVLETYGDVRSHRLEEWRPTVVTDSKEGPYTVNARIE